MRRRAGSTALSTASVLRRPKLSSMARCSRPADEREDYGEERFISTGQLGTLVVVVVHTSRSGRIRLISARMANRKERQTYYERLQETA